MILSPNALLRQGDEVAVHVDTAKSAENEKLLRSFQKGRRGTMRFAVITCTTSPFWFTVSVLMRAMPRSGRFSEGVTLGDVTAHSQRIAGIGRTRPFDGSRRHR